MAAQKGKPGSGKGRGRPRIEIDAAEVEKLAGEGLADYQIAEALGVERKTLMARKKDTPAVAEALKAGRRAAREKVENVAYKCALMALEKPQYQTSLIFWLKAKAGWKETQVVEQVETDGVESREQIAGRIRELITRA